MGVSPPSIPQSCCLATWLCCTQASCLAMWRWSGMQAVGRFTAGLCRRVVDQKARAHAIAVSSMAYSVLPATCLPACPPVCVRTRLNVVSLFSTPRCRGEAIVDENMLTGEAVPVRKVSYSPAVDGLNYDPDVLKSCTLYGGTTVAQVCTGKIAAGCSAVLGGTGGGR